MANIILKIRPIREALGWFYIVQRKYDICTYFVTIRQYNWSHLTFLGTTTTKTSF